jgi:hypothetical protein
MTPFAPRWAVFGCSLVLVSSLAGCAKDAGAGSAPAPAAEPAAATAPAGGQKLGDLQRQQRKVIKNADLSMRVASPSSAARTAESIAERHGGYLASSDSSDSTNPDGSEPSEVSVTIRVNADELDTVLDELRRLSNHVGSEKITSQDVTEEWVDLDARLKTQKKLEEQYQEISKSATKVDDLLATQKQLAEVRGEIEKIEGRKRLLENQVALSTVTVRFEAERPLVAVSASAFGRSLRRAGADSVTVGANLVIGVIRIAGVLTPIALLIFLPALLLFRWLRRFWETPLKA